MACSKTLSLNESAGGDMPLNQAVYVPSNGGYILGARPGRIFKLDATTGEKIYELQWYGPTEFYSGIAYHAATDTIYAGLSSPLDQGADLVVAFGSYPAVEGLYSFNPADLTAGPTRFPLETHIFADFVDYFWHAGPWKVVSSGDWLVFKNKSSTFTVMNPASSGVYAQGADGNPNDPWAHIPLMDFAWNDASEILYVADQGWPALRRFNMAAYPASPNAHNINDSEYAGNEIYWRNDVSGSSPNNNNAPYLCGICYSPLNNTVYATTGTDVIYKADITAETFDTFFALGRSAAKPYHIRYNSVDGLIYVPCWTDNTVCVIDPADDSIVVKTGFDCPVDMVFTPSKKFAVQAGGVGLKEVT